MNRRSDISGFGEATAGVAPLAITVSAQVGTISGSINTSSSFGPTNLETDGLTYAGCPLDDGFPVAAVETAEFDFGNQDSFGTAGVNLFLNGVAVGAFAPGAPSNSDAVTGETA